MGPISDISTVVMVPSSCHQQRHWHAVHILPHHATHRHDELDPANGSSLINLPSRAISPLTSCVPCKALWEAKKAFIAETHNSCSNTHLFSTLFEIHLWSPGHPFPKHQVFSGGLSHLSQSPTPHHHLMIFSSSDRAGSRVSTHLPASWTF